MCGKFPCFGLFLLFRRSLKPFLRSRSSIFITVMVLSIGSCCGTNCMIHRWIKSVDCSWRERLAREAWIVLSVARASCGSEVLEVLHCTRTIGRKIRTVIFPYVQLAVETYSELLSIEIEVERFMEIRKPDFSYLEIFCSPTGRWFFICLHVE